MVWEGTPLLPSGLPTFMPVHNCLPLSAHLAGNRRALLADSGHTVDPQLHILNSSVHGNEPPEFAGLCVGLMPTEGAP